METDDAFAFHFYTVYTTFLNWIWPVWASQVALVAKKSACQSGRHEIRVRFLGWEDPLKEGMATHSSILAWRILWTEENPVDRQAIVQRSDQFSRSVVSNSL